MILIPTDEKDIDKRLDVFMAERGNITRSASQKLLKDGLVKVNGKVILKSYKTKINDVIEFEIPKAVESENIPQNIELDIVYEDKDLLVVNKPRGMVVHPAAGNPDNTLVNALLYHCGDSLSGINGVIRPGIVHRIDKDTSGLLVVAKNDKTHVSLAEQIKSHSFDRFYEAIICGRFKETKGTIDAPIGRHPKDRKKMAIVSDGRNAVTHYEVITEYDGFSHVRFKLETGRTHQIRVHASSKGHSLVGDRLYGARDKLGIEGQCLHAKTISFVHPVSNKLLSFDSELPDYFKDILSKLRIKDNEYS
ncbi:MAG: RluA family pseudouridine synthase [Ruminococcaceae bacterium]|nr:RluA family pseudouridine synthase [Oscillospiraceae bacterium]